MAAFHSASLPSALSRSSAECNKMLCKAAAKKESKMCRVCCVSFYVKINVLEANMNSEKKHNLPFFFCLFSF